MKMADIHERQGHLEEALRLLRQEVWPVFERLDDVRSRALTLRKIASIRQQLGEQEEALRLHEAVLRVFERQGDVRERAFTLRRMAVVYQHQGDFQTALRLLEEALHVFVNLRDERARALTLGQIANVRQQRGELKEALQLHAEVSLIFERLGDERERAFALEKMADIQQQSGELRDAERLYREMLLGSSRPDNERFRAHTFQKLANVLQQLGRIEEALTTLRTEVLPVFEKLEDADAQLATRRAISLLTRTIRDPAFTIRSLKIRNIKNIEALELDFTLPSQLQGQWRCIAGINGAGKSTILQAIACVLLGEPLVLELGGERLQNMRRRTGPDDAPAEVELIVSNGRETIDLLLPLGPEGLDLRRLRAHERYDAMREFWDWRAQNHLLVSYGAGRNLSEQGATGMRDKSRDVQRQFTLFEPLAQVAHADVLTRQGLMPPAALKALQAVLSDVLADSPVCVQPGTERLELQVDGALVSTSELPDGFRALITWLADLCTTWHEKAPDEAALGDLSLLRGIVLLDEIDLHLHPRLQRTLVPRLRRLLPGIQWIVTTHSPLVLASFDSNEIVPLSGPSGGGGHPLDRQILGFSTDEVYRWLMGTEPTSAEMDELWKERQKNPEKLGLLLAQSPEVNEEEVRRNVEWRKQRLEELRRKKREEK